MLWVPRLILLVRDKPKIVMSKKRSICRQYWTVFDSVFSVISQSVYNKNIFGLNEIIWKTVAVWSVLYSINTTLILYTVIWLSTLSMEIMSSTLTSDIKYLLCSRRGQSCGRYSYVAKTYPGEWQPTDTCCSYTQKAVVTYYQFSDSLCS